MHVSLATVALLLCHSASAFVPGGRTFTRITTTMYMSDEEPKSRRDQDMLERARKAAKEDEPMESPKLFGDDLLGDMRETLLKLEKRVKDGPGSLSMLEVEEFEAATQRILVEMKGHVAAPPAAARVVPASVSVAASPPPAAAAVDSAAAPMAASPPPVEVRSNQEVTDTSLDEGPAYDGTGGMGLAKGTRNTYIIEGMDEMSPEEYRKALQQSVIDRQSRRKDNRSGVVGNRAALQYLDQLGWGGASNNWQKKEEPEEEDKESQ